MDGYLQEACTTAAIAVAKTVQRIQVAGSKGLRQREYSAGGQAAGDPGMGQPVLATVSSTCVPLSLS